MNPDELAATIRPALIRAAGWADVGTYDTHRMLYGVTADRYAIEAAGIAAGLLALEEEREHQADSERRQSWRSLGLCPQHGPGCQVPRPASLSAHEPTRHPTGPEVNAARDSGAWHVKAGPPGPDRPKADA